MAFSSHYTQKMIEIVEEMTWGRRDREVGMDEEGNITQQPLMTNSQQVQRQLQELVSYAFETDPSRLLNLILKMNSTIRHFKTASYLLIHLLQLRKLQGLLPLDRTYLSPVELAPANPQLSHFHRFLKDMQLYTQKHLKRIEKYTAATLWLDHVAALNPIG